ncbi:MAG: phosphatidylserine decarboxylase [Sulfurimonas sp.]|jgi:phosphatidylserine decarboxylase|nr:phosphatidylserine decarboxylase [Sulfurimonadaceae bacterium]
MGNNLPIAKNGIKFICTSLFMMVLFWLFGCGKVAFLALAVSIFFIFVFRNPERERLFFEDSSVLSPVDGVLSDVVEDEQKDEYILTIQNSCLNVALLRSPFDATIKTIELVRGARVSPASKLFDKLNENATLVFTNKNEQSIKINHRLKQTIKSIDIDTKVGNKLFQGSRYGFALNNTTTIYLPRSFRLNINIGDELRAGESLVGYFS